MSKLEQQWLEVFRAGNYGDKGNYTAADMAQIAADYDPAHHEAPLVVGHPEHDSPAYGWAEALRADGDILFAKPKDVDPKFEDAVLKGRYKKRSIALYPRDSAGKLRLRHIGWLGAMPPEVKGLKDAHFGDEPFETIEFSEGTQESSMAGEVSEKSIIDAVKAFFTERLGGKPETQPAFSEASVAALVEKALAPLKAQLDAEHAARVAVEAKFAESQTAAGKSLASSRVETAIAHLKNAKRWLPAYDRMGVPQLFAVLAGPAVTEIEFGEGDKKRKLDGVQLFEEVLNSIGKIVPEGEYFSPSQTSVSKVVQFNASPGIEVDLASVAFNDGVEARMKEKKISFAEAYRELTAEGFKPIVGAAAAGAV